MSWPSGAGETLLKGQEFFNDYGRLNNEQLLLTYTCADIDGALVGGALGSVACAPGGSEVGEIRMRIEFSHHGVTVI